MDIANLNYALADFGEILALFIESAGMVAENKQRELRGESMAYTDVDFQKISGAIGYYTDQLRQL